MDHTKNRNPVMIGCLMIQMCVGILYLWSALKGDLIRAYGEADGWTASAANLVSSFMLFFYVFGCLAGGILNDRKGPRLTCFTGIILFTGGIALSAFARPLYAFTLTYAVMAGLGSGFGNIACITCLQKWLPHRRGLASGMASAAFGLSTVIFTPLSSRLMDVFRGEDGIVRFTPVFLFLAVTFAVLGLIGASLVRLPDQAYIEGLRLPEHTGDGAADMPLPQVVRTAAFWALFFSIFFINGTWNLCVPVMKDLGIQRGLAESAAIACISFTGITNTVGRLAMSALSDKLGRSRTMVILCGITFAGAVLLSFVTGSMYFITTAMVAFAYGGAAPLFAAICTDLFGAEYAGTNLGVALLALGFSSVFFNFISGNVLRATVDHMTTTFVMSAATAVIPVFLTLYLKPRLKK